MEWISVKEKLPKKEGKYVVKTVTSMGNTHKVETFCTITKGKAHFGVNNQIVTHWLQEE